MSIDMNAFVRSDYNTLINNVSSSVSSSLFKKINPYQGILEPVEIQDENYSDPRYTRVRYEGSKVTSAKYNFYTAPNTVIEWPAFVGSQSVQWEGDKSFGKTAAVDFYVDKFAFATNINKKNLNFYDKSVVNLKYLIDATGSVTELSRENRNIFEIQSMYKKGDKATVSLFDKYNPTNQAPLDGSKVVFEGGYNYSPIMYRELNETMYFTYISPEETTSNRLGVKGVNTGSFVWKTVGDTNTDFSTTPNGSNTIFTINGVSTTTQAFSLSKTINTSWPYSEMPLFNFSNFIYKDYLNNRRFINSDLWNTSFANADLAHFYSLDWFIPNGTDTAVGGYETNDMTGKLVTVKNSSEYYVYAIAPRDSSYVINVDVPIKVKATNKETGGERAPEKGPSLVKVIGVIEVQKNGSTTWDYRDPNNAGAPYGYTKFVSTNIPIASGGRSATDTRVALVNEENSFLYFPEDTVGGTVNGQYITPYFEGRCQLFGKKIKLGQDDKVRVKFYFAEVTTFFRRSENIYFELPVGDTSKTYFEVYDENFASVSLASSVSIPSTPAIFTANSDNQTLTFDDSVSVLYNSVIFEPQDTNNPNSISNLYSFVEFPFRFERYDIIRFTSFYSVRPEYYYIMSVQEPIISFVGNTKTVLKPLAITLDRTFNPNTISTTHFAFFRRFPDETTVMIDYKKKDGLTSNALLIPYNLKPETAANVANIVAPLKDTILSKVLLT